MVGEVRSVGADVGKCLGSSGVVARGGVGADGREMFRSSGDVAGAMGGVGADAGDAVGLWQVQGEV